MSLFPEDPAGGRAAQVVLLPSPAGLPESLTYSVPGRLRSAVRLGVPVLVPLAGREHLGYVVEVGPVTAEMQSLKLQPIHAVPRPEPAFDAPALRLLREVAREYRCPLGEVLPLAVPERHGCTVQSIVEIADWDGSLPPRLGLLTRRTLEQVHSALVAAGGELPLDRLKQEVPAPNLPQVLRRARLEGWVREARVLLPPRVQGRIVQGVRRLESDGGSSENGQRLGHRQRDVLERLEEQDEPEQKRRLVQELGVGYDTLKRLRERGLVETVPVEVRRSPRLPRVDASPPAELTRPQQGAVEAIESARKRGAGDSLLLFGVTGSGKTEVYLRAVEMAREGGRTAALLVPEISLTAQVAAQVRARLGERVAILHSGLSEGERFDEWERLRKGKADVVVGPRSALYAPFAAPGLIVLDEEHDASYKQDQPAPRYHAREVAQRRARLGGGCCVLGSATPSLESFWKAQRGDYRLLELPDRVEGRPLPSVEVVDLRAGQGRKPAVFGPRLAEAIDERLARGEQVILFLNRRGFSAFLLCRDCGHVPRCAHCSVSLTLHQSERTVLLCHHCGHRQPVPTLCPHCGGQKLGQFGLGTQRVEEEVRRRFPSARVARLDRDTAGAKDAPARLLEAVRAREVDVLIGTQMVSKGFDFPGVTLVGVVTADVALNVPDFRAAERCFQLLTQVAGRAGRGDQPGEVILQTFQPEHPAIQAASRHDYRGFYSQEIRGREELGYPPFGSLARLLTAQETEPEAIARMDAAAQILGPACRRHGVRLLGPASCPLARIRERWRWHLLLKGPTREAVGAVLDDAWAGVQRAVGGIALDVEPQDLQ